MTHRYLTTITGEDIQSVYTDDGDSDHRRDRDKSVTQEKRADNEECKEGKEHNPLLFSFNDGHILSIIFVNHSLCHMSDPFYTDRTEKTVRPENEDNNHYDEWKYLGKTSTGKKRIEITGS